MTKNTVNEKERMVVTRDLTLHAHWFGRRRQTRNM